MGATGERLNQAARRNRDGLAALVVAWAKSLEPAGWEGSPDELADELAATLARHPRAAAGVFHVSVHQVGRAAAEAAAELRRAGWRVESRRTRYGRVVRLRRVGRSRPR